MTQATTKPLEPALPYALLFALFIAALLFRPLLPIDETRYMTVAWEMFLQKQYAVLSLNFAPYHHKPPLLFWLINAVWEIFGVSRGTALIPVFAASAAVLFLTGKLADDLRPQKPAPDFTRWLMLGALPFLIYSTLVMFDMMLTVWLLACLLVFRTHARAPKSRYPLIAGLLIGLGVLTKGPVIYLYVLWPLLLYPFWRNDSFIPAAKFYKGVGIAVAVSALPVLTWLIPALSQTGENFAFWLVWNQTAGRVSGNFSSAHVHSIFFYFAFLPVLFVPWAFFPAFWKNLRIVRSDPAFRFLGAASIPVFISFSLIAGKQPHYLLPLLPFVIVGTAVLLEKKERTIRTVALFMVLLAIAGQAIANRTVFHKYDLAPIATFYHDHNNEDRDWAFVRKYQGELGFLARIEKPVASMDLSALPRWLEEHPGGLAIVRHSAADIGLENCEEIFVIPYRSRKLGVFGLKGENHDNIPRID